MDQFVSEVEREMADERARQQALVQQQPESGPSMSVPRSGRSGEEQRRKPSRDGRDRASRIDQHQKTHDKVEKWRRRYDHETVEYPPSPYPESSAALGRSKSDQRLHPSERSSRHIRETRSADFRQSVYDHDPSIPSPSDANYPPSPYTPREVQKETPPEPAREERHRGHERYASEPAERQSRALLSPTEQPAERAPQRERANSQRKTNKYPPMPNVPVVYTTRTRSREDRVDIPPS
ncbi:hypothetical protein FA13DRAFT_1785859 [Coprinellus micaceus]|uniref:Uncharacterized protein n=1 Tax=Coprinellus micaceus TaxID=71717 RepID=A0A4Y7TVQ5_COPMI|nr:hypothetical protein FA13DRAFT_1785859 [Coprinellus micaceus]